MSRPLIAVVRGGYSGESVISHQSAARMLGAIDSARYEALYVTVARDSWSCSDAGEKSITFD
ncbi:MAG: hypothetical protein KA175_16620, partial [Flavobacteriales bacterium]|nr:hypothetical protein [Flavobacteriales bacterium]